MQIFHKTVGAINYTRSTSYDAENYSKGLSSNDPNLSYFILSIEKPYAHLHYASNMFTKSLKTVEVVDYTLQCQNDWLVDFGLNGPLRQYFSLYRAVSQREGERKEK